MEKKLRDIQQQCKESGTCICGSTVIQNQITETMRLVSCTNPDCKYFNGVQVTKQEYDKWYKWKQKYLNRPINNEINKMTQQQKINKVKQFGQSLGLPYKYWDNTKSENEFWKSISNEESFEAQIQSLKQFYVRKSWYQRHNEEFGFDWFLQEFPFKYPGIETKQQLDAYLEDKVLQIRKKIANGERAENDQQRKARRQKDAKYWKDKQNQYRTITNQKQFVLFEVTKEQAEWFFNQHNRMISEYRLVSDTVILSGINKYKAIKYKTQYEQDEIPCVNLSLCDIYLNVIQD